MINAFLTHLDNIPQEPGDIYWPEFEAREIPQPEQALRDVVIGAGLNRREHFLRCAQLTYLVSNSPFVDAITAADPRVTYSKNALRDLFRLRGSLVTAYGATPIPRLVFGEQSGTPNVVTWAIRVETVALPNITVSVTDTFTGVRDEFVLAVSGDTSEQLQLPGRQGVITLYGPSFDVGDNWSLMYQRDIESWVAEVYHRVFDLNPSGVLSPALLRQFNSAPLVIDKLAAVAAGLGGYAP